MIALRCPVCARPLQAQERSWACEERHSFDVAREGYVNLLLVQQKKSREPGDSQEMVQARRDFLAADFYAPLRESALGLLRPLKAETLLDIGCGEGYYTSAFSTVAGDVTGLDIAKPAVQIAAKRFRNISWLVGSAAALPVVDQAADVVSSLFSPLPTAEMARVLRPDGALLVATPNRQHLWSLRETLFDEVKAHEPEKFLTELSPAFRLQARLDLAFPLHLPNSQALRNLLLMTPYYWRAKPDKRALVEHRADFHTEAAFTLLLLRKNATP